MAYSTTVLYIGGAGGAALSQWASGPPSDDSGPPTLPSSRRRVDHPDHPCLTFLFVIWAYLRLTINKNIE